MVALSIGSDGINSDRANAAEQLPHAHHKMTRQIKDSLFLTSCFYALYMQFSGSGEPISAAACDIRCWASAGKHLIIDIC